MLLFHSSFQVRDLRAMCPFFFDDAATTESYTLSLHDALPILKAQGDRPDRAHVGGDIVAAYAVAAGDPAHQAALLVVRSEEHTSELQSLRHLVCRLLLEKKNDIQIAEAYIQRNSGASDTMLNE